MYSTAVAHIHTTFSALQRFGDNLSVDTTPWDRQDNVTLYDDNTACTAHTCGYEQCMYLCTTYIRTYCTTNAKRGLKHNRLQSIRTACVDSHAHTHTLTHTHTHTVHAHTRHSPLPWLHPGGPPLLAVQWSQHVSSQAHNTSAWRLSVGTGSCRAAGCECCATVLMDPPNDRKEAVKHSTNVYFTTLSIPTLLLLQLAQKYMIWQLQD